MNFKEWLHIQETIDPDTEKAVASFVSKLSPEAKTEAEKELAAFRNQAAIVPKGQVFKVLQDKFLQKKEKAEGGQRKHFANIAGTTEEELKTFDFFNKESPTQLKEMMELLRKFIDKKLITLKIENEIPILFKNTIQGQERINTPDFTRFISQIHSIRDNLVAYSSKGTHFNPMEEELNHQANLVAKGDNIWVFKGHAPDLCRIFGKGHAWCISSSTSVTHWFNYRIEHGQTQYFIFDFNKDENDPARYVNPGVAPEGGYSEWVDARNEHRTDPEDRDSEVGINGYESINQYKKYLASKGIPASIWTTSEPEDWEKRLNSYLDYDSFIAAKVDRDKRIFPLYLKIAAKITDNDFDTLTDAEKKEFLLGKAENISNKQFKYAVDNFKGAYQNSLAERDRFDFFAKINDYESISKLINMHKIDFEQIESIINNATDKDKAIKFIGADNITRLTSKHIRKLLDNAKDKTEMAKIISNSGIDKFSGINKLEDREIHDMFTDIIYNNQELADIILKHKTNITNNNIIDLFVKSNEENVAKTLGEERIKNLPSDIISDILDQSKEAKDPQKTNKLIKILGKDNINKLSGDDIYFLANDGSSAFDIIQHISDLNKIKPVLDQSRASTIYYLLKDGKKQGKLGFVEDLIINHKDPLVNSDIYALIYNSDDKVKMAEKLGEKINLLSRDNVKSLIEFAENKEQMAEILGKTNINKLKDEDVTSLFEKAHRNVSREEKNEFINLILKHKTNLSPANVFDLMLNTDNLDKMVEMLGRENIENLSSDHVAVLLTNATDKEKMARILDKNNIRKLSTENIKKLVRYAEDKAQMINILMFYADNKHKSVWDDLIRSYNVK